MVQKQIMYTTTEAPEVYMVWAMMDEELPKESSWPPGSFLKDKLVWTKMDRTNDHFATTLTMHAGAVFYYWMVQLTDKDGNSLNYWDAGGNEKLYFMDSMPYWAGFRPGYFLFLAGCIPLLISFIKNKKKKDSHPIGPTNTVNEYIPQFDAIRAIAVILVIIHHWIPQESILNFTSNGRIGVNIFFVLSGFLITGILLKSKMQVENNGVKRSLVFRNFYVRRTLRIFPIYYLFLIVLLFIGDPNIKKDGIYYFTYTPNYLFYFIQHFPGRVAHLWSLAVEEQFYLIWPWLIVLVNKKTLPYIIALFIVIGITTNYIITGSDWWVEILTPACFDALAIGAFLSYLTIYRQDVIAILKERFSWIASFVILLFMLDVLKISFIPSRTSHALLAAVLILYCLFMNNNKILNYILHKKWLIRLGKVSYGVYLYHLIVPELWNRIIHKFSEQNIDLFYNKVMPLPFEPAWLFIQQFSFLILICFLSWTFLEKPINNLKRKFENRISSPAEKMPS